MENLFLFLSWDETVVITCSSAHGGLEYRYLPLAVSITRGCWKDTRKSSSLPEAGIPIGRLAQGNDGCARARARTSYLKRNSKKSCMILQRLSSPSEEATPRWPFYVNFFILSILPWNPIRSSHKSEPMFTPIRGTIFRIHLSVIRSKVIALSFHNFLLLFFLGTAILPSLERFSDFY